jgi:hypothetical protein
MICSSSSRKKYACGVTEFMVWATSLRQPNAHSGHRGGLGIVAENIDPRTLACYYDLVRDRERGGLG